MADDVENSSKVLAYEELSWRIMAWEAIVDLCGRAESPEISRWLTSTEAEQSSNKTADAGDLAAQADPTVHYAIREIPVFEGHVLGLTGPGRTRIRVVRASGLDIARDCIKKEKCWPLVVNMASMEEPGGDVPIGAEGQEEELFRRTNYHKTLKRHSDGQSHYPMTATVAYSPRVTVLADSDYAPLSEPYPVAILACPYARRPPLEKRGEAYAKRADASDMAARVRAIFRIGVLYSHNAIIAGPLGCEPRGGHPARQVAEIFQREAAEHDGKFREIVLAFPPSISEEDFRTFGELLSYSPPPSPSPAVRASPGLSAPPAGGAEPKTLAERKARQGTGRRASDSDLTPKRGETRTAAPGPATGPREMPSARPASAELAARSGVSAAAATSPLSYPGTPLMTSPPASPADITRAPERQKVRRRLSDIRPIRARGKSPSDQPQPPRFARCAGRTPNQAFSAERSGPDDLPPASRPGCI